MTIDIEALKRVMFPVAMAALDRISADSNRRFVHYTSAEAAIKIMRSEKIWLRNTLLMNDFMEIRHGMRCVEAALGNPTHGASFDKALESVFSGLSGYVRSAFRTLRPSQELETYIFSVGEHHSPREDGIGKLSMWRAYGQNTGVALVFEQTPFVSEATSLNAFATPVIYADPDEFVVAYFAPFVSGLHAQQALLKQLAPSSLLDIIVKVLHFAVVSTKHPGFSEELEWRVVYSGHPVLFPTPASQPSHIVPEVVVLQGVPQTVQMLPLKAFPQEGFSTAIPDVLHQIIIGPTPQPPPVWWALVQELERLGVAGAREKVKVSNIPLRT